MMGYQALLRCTWFYSIVTSKSITKDINDSLLLVIGDVTSSSARVLYDQVPGSVMTLQVRVYKTMATSQDALVDFTAIQTLELSIMEPAKVPQMITLHDLEPGQRYVVQFEMNEPKQAATIMFHTARAPSNGNVWTDRVVVFSCDRFVEDHDDTLMERIASDVEAHDDALGSSSVHFGTAHVGDQIYADAGDLSIKLVPFPIKDMANDVKRRARYDAILEQFRGIYRKTFGRKAAQRVLRVGAHWMLPDDHEIINNFNFELVQKAFQASENSRLSESERELLVALQLHCRAGLQAYYEYQYQLYHAFPWHKVNFLTDALDDIIQTYPVYFTVELEHYKLLFFDVRFERSFFNASQLQDHPKLISDEQRHFFIKKLQLWSSDDQNTAVVFTSMPLFFQSAFSAAIAHLVERESYPGLEEQRLGLEDLFHLFQIAPQKKHFGTQHEASSLVRLLVAGDLHMAAHSRVCGTKGTNFSCLEQLITSGVTNGSTAIEDTKLIPYYYFITQLTPVFEIAYSWALSIPLLSSLLPRSSPWYIAYDRVYLGRNYGILEFSANGSLTWNQTVLEPYKKAYQSCVQSFIDVSTPKILGFVALVLNASIIYRFVVNRCTKNLKQAVKTTKTQ